MAHSDREQDLRVVLHGNVGAGKSESGNTLLGSSCFLSELSGSAVTQQCEAQTVTLGGKRIMVVDTPGLTATMDSNTAKKKLLQCLQLSAPGPHVFLLVIPLGRFTQDERDTVDRLIEVFGQKLYMFTIILFTFKRKNTSIEEYIRTAGDSLQQLVQKCGSRYHAFSENPGKKDQEELLAKIDKLVAANGGRWYTNTDDEMKDLEMKLKHQHLGGGSLTSKTSVSEKLGSLIHSKRPDSPEPSCVSMKSDQSMDRDIAFKQGESSPELR
ncbi:GTPase IMAP family member 4-like [Colossoma macropomum]|uniref:GTPase IMAP family member 4-like n=1 Tax=Colossoma macropomum TaxID=42526 RepID=UPI0018650148|nr:GTPase IMAP family member 4-like [Colossoma macropomum]XP_036419891.1 GTPase IMAP family member 4-like [Colossoma macropomum]